MSILVYRFDECIETRIKALSGFPPEFLNSYVPCTADSLYAEEIAAALSEDGEHPVLTFGACEEPAPEIPDCKSVQDIVDYLDTFDGDIIELPVLFGQQGKLFASLAQTSEYLRYEALDLFVQTTCRTMLWIREKSLAELVSNVQSRPADTYSFDAKRTQWATHEKNAEALAMILPLMKDGFAPPPATL